jgi:hypothetical protein
MTKPSENKPSDLEVKLDEITKDGAIKARKTKEREYGFFINHGRDSGN